jgi:hypothetical protein
MNWIKEKIRAPWREDDSEISEVRERQIVVKLGQGIQIIDKKTMIDVKFGDNLIETLRLLGNPNKQYSPDGNAL